MKGFSCINHNKFTIMVLVSSGAPCILGRVGVAGMQRTFLINIFFQYKKKSHSSR